MFKCAFECLTLKKFKGIQPHLYKRYIDDIFFMWRASEKELQDFIKHLNSQIIHPFIKFKASYDIEKSQSSF